ncbi:MAG: hypothetical protein JWO36_2067 [Myxococcales bacterium]|nr:hypothetical protein [Myxococcales bacterium]
MITRLALLLCLIVMVACSSDKTPVTVDAAVTVDSGPAPGSFGAACTTVTDTSTECTSGVCTNTINMIPHPVCSKKCTILQGTDPSCPVGSMGMRCNQQGYCRP